MLSSKNILKIYFWICCTLLENQIVMRYSSIAALTTIQKPGCHFPRGSAGITPRKFKDLLGNSTQVSHLSVENVPKGGKGTLNYNISNSLGVQMA